MALSGRINGTVSRNSAYFSFYIDWDVTNSEADRIAYNRSVVRVKVYLATNNTARQFDTVSSRSHWVKIDGSTDSWNARIDCNPWPSNPYLLRTYSKTVYHNSDGTKSLNISAYVDATASTWGADNCNASATITLDTIPRSSVISSFPDFTIGDTFTVAITRYSPSFTHDLTLKRGSEIIATRTGIGTSYDFTLTTTEQDRIYASIPNSTSVTLTLYCTTKNGSTTIGSTVSKTATAYVSSSIVPTFTSLTATETNPAVSAVTSSFVQNLSRIKFTINGAAGAKYSTISSYKIVFNGVTYNSSTATTGAINKSGNLTATATITDSRGRTASKSITVAMSAYSPPQITSLTVKRCNSDGTLNEMGDYASVYMAGTWSGVGNNTCTIRIMSRVRGTSTWTTKHTSEDTSPPSFGTTQIVGIYNITSSYDFRIEAQDKFNTTISLAILPTGIVPMSWGKEGIGVGKVYEQGALDVGGDSYFGGNIDARNVRLRAARFYTLTSWADQLDGDPRCWNIHVPSTTGTPSVQLGYTNNNGDRFTYTLTHDHPYAPTSHTHSSLSGASYIQSTGRSTSWGSTNGTSTGAFNAIMGTSSGATWLLSGTSGGTFRGGIQLRDDGTVIRFYAGSTNLSFTSSLGEGEIWRSQASNTLDIGASLNFKNPTGRDSQIRTTTTSGRQFLILSGDSGDTTLGGHIALYGANDGSYPKYIFGYSGGTNSFRCSGSGNFHVYGSLSKASGTFRIDHPLDPENKDLIHGFVEAPRYDLIYRGVTRLENGRAIVNIDHDSRMTEGTFEALTQNAVVVSLCNQSGFARVKPTEVVNGSFSIICEDDESTDTIAWVVLAERADVFIRYHDGTCVDENGQLVPEQLKEVLTEDKLKLLTTNEDRKMALGKYTELEDTALGNTEIENCIELGNLRGFRGYLLNPEEYRIKALKNEIHELKGE